MGQLASTALRLAAMTSACAQQEAAMSPVSMQKDVESSRIYTYVKQMPQLPGGGGQQRLAMDIVKRLQLSGKVEPSCYRAKVYFEVNPAGAIQHARITAGSRSAAIDSALLQAVQSLPVLHAGHQQGRPVTVSFTIPFNIATQ